ncbi:hypothetical protein [Halomonas daqiaonensis]|uniref:Uncharacterized protein n=1 Tax=Halomonas daqiaonensis TaxID=650850 RepID=A0A1H7IMM1_9GAMM|nr:hypothetical protein [Halomonas daqiaonensis]SEK61995.1 hypothetical protein SAMN04488129_103122 [Halomonas daqiaonensis]
MPAAITDNGPGDHGSRSRRRATRWWLAGLLVGCLLPASLAQVDSLRLVERTAQVSLLVPTLLRVRSRLHARRRALVRWVRLVAGRARIEARAVVRPFLQPCHPVAAHDVLTRRGPPCLR